ncbi:MAG: ATP synthase F1 subunit gamma [Actinobacteria bacterium]|nr:ATP synthase F1 subunit gamma [Dehalococcoidia bacterium]MCB0874411.1 ATP synthase F1 subunit gamma [Thermoleophilia bacterium]MCB9010565.1 ATP synthase F1 subunit gamma [Actinomycetota bacterium]
MASSRDIKRRIDSVRGTRKITRAMELVASARLRRAQEQIESLRPYAKSMQRLMSQAARQSGTLKGLPLLDERPEIENALVLTITGDRGLAGAFNVNVLRAGFQAADALRVEGAGQVKFVPVGKKGAGTLRFRGAPIERSYEGFSSSPTFMDASHVAEFVVQEFVEGRADRVILVYNAFKSVMEQAITVDQLLPIDRTRVVDEDEEASEGTQSRSLAIFEPAPEELLERLLPTYVDTTIYRAMLESAAAEHAARRTAMRNASDNAGTLIDDLTLAMNRARQAAITQEILEVVAGADALD